MFKKCLWATKHFYIGPLTSLAFGIGTLWIHKSDKTKEIYNKIGTLPTLHPVLNRTIISVF